VTDTSVVYILPPPPNLHSDGQYEWQNFFFKLRE
jgi:hypothetical protein